MFSYPLCLNLVFFVIPLIFLLCSCWLLLGCSLSRSSTLEAPAQYNMNYFNTLQFLAVIWLQLAHAISFHPTLTRYGQVVDLSSSPLEKRSLPLMLLLRGGAAESASAWNAGSKYEYRAGAPNSKPITSTSTRSPPVGQRQDVKLDTKDAFAEAFLQRDDRNRFIGEFLLTIHNSSV